MDKKPYVEEVNPLVGYIRQKFQQSETSKIFDEKRWLKSYRNYRGLYGPEMAFRENEKSRVFVKVTKTKVLAAFGQIIEVLFSQGKFPIGIEPTPVPEDTPQYAHLKPKPPQPPQDPYGFNGDAREIPPGATADMLMENLAQEYKNLGFDDGPAPDLKTMPQIEPAMLAAEKMQKLALFLKQRKRLTQIRFFGRLYSIFAVSLSTLG